MSSADAPPHAVTVDTHASNASVSSPADSSSHPNGKALSEGEATVAAHYATAAAPSVSANQLLALQQQQQQQYSSNKSLVEHSKHAQQQAQDGSTHHAPLHPPSSSPPHYGLVHPSSGSYSASTSSASPSTASPLTASPIDGYANGAQVVPYPVDGSPHAFKGYGQQEQQQYQQSVESHYLSAGHTSMQQQQQQQYAPPPPNATSNAAFTQVLVAGLPPSLTQAELGEIFLHMPMYERCGIACDPVTGVSIGRGWLVFGSAEAAQTAISQMSGLVIGGSTLHLSLMQPIGESTKSNIYVAGLPKQYTQAQLEHLFETFGTIIESKILTDPTGASRGVAFVRYDNSNSAAQAITAVNGHVLADAHHSYTIRVKFARDHHRNADPTMAMLTGQPALNQANGNSGQHAPRPAAIYQSYIPPGVKSRGEDLNGGVALFVFHIPAEFTSRDLHELFAPCATVLSARIAIHPQTLESKGYGFVTCLREEEAHQAVILLNGRRVGRKFIKVSFKKQTTPPTQAHHQQQINMPHAGQLQLGHQQQHHSPHAQQHTPLQQSQRPPSQAPASLDINLSSLAAALSMTQGFNAVNYAPQQTAPVNNAWNQGSAAAPAGGPSLVNYNQNLPLHLLMQQMQLGQAFPPQSHSPQQASINAQQQQQQQQAQQSQQGGQSSQSPQPNSMYSFSPQSGSLGAQQPQAQQNQWSPASPLHLGQSAAAAAQNNLYGAAGGQYYNSPPPPQQQQQNQPQPSQQQQQLFM